MRISRSRSYALSVLAAAALLAGCNGNGGSQASGLTPSSGANAATLLHDPNPQVVDASTLSDTFAGVTWSGNPHPDRNLSWVSPDVQRAPRLLFVSDVETDDVYIFTMPDMTLKGTITGFNQPQGECSDRHGNIYVADTQAKQVEEFSRTGTLLNTYVDKYGYPVGCAINPVNGDIAITNIRGFHHAPGQVLVFSSPSAKPTVLTNHKQYSYYFDGYDPYGHLWVDGRDARKAFILSSCTPSRCHTVKLSGGKIYFPGAVQADPKLYSWVVFDQLCGGKSAACSYWVANGGMLGQATDYRHYKGGAVCDLIQGVIAAYGKKYTAGADYPSKSCRKGDSYEARWQYPDGGTPTNYTTSVSGPVGAAVSTKVSI
jgi:hypothetical protein